MAKYRKKPVIIEAEQWTRHGDDKDVSCYDPYNEYEDKCKHCNKLMEDHGWVATLEGGHIVCPGDWIIIGVKGEKYPIKNDIFLETYEKVN